MTGAIGKHTFADITNVMRDSLHTYTALFRNSNFAIGDFSDFAHVAEKEYTARTAIPVLYKREEVGTLYALIFTPGDGTGSEEHYTTDPAHVSDTKKQVYIPDNWRHVDRPRSVTPRNKDSVLMEAFFPFFSLVGDNILANTVSLEEIGLEKRHHAYVKKLWDLGVGDNRYEDDVRSGNNNTPRIQLTTGTRYYGLRDGDPHAIYFNPRVAPGVSAQVAGFLAVHTSGNPLTGMLENIADFPQRLVTK
jgi:hypothetical protein